MTVQDALARPFSAKLTVEDYLLLDRSGAFDAYAKTELIDGRVYAVNATMSEHFIAASRLFRRLADSCDALGTGIEAWAEGSVEIAPHNVPQPDMIVTSATPAAGLAAIEAILLVVEVAATTLVRDLNRKRRVYARAGVPEYWVVNVAARVVHQMWSPAADTYAERREIPFGTPIEAATVPGLRVATANL